MHHGARAEAVHQPAQNRPEQRAFDGLQRGREGKAVLLQPFSSDSMAT